MKAWRSVLLKRLLRIRPEEATFARRGFRSASPEAQTRLEQVGTTFLGGYHAALEDRGLSELTSKLEAVGLEFRGFAYEGAAMALDLLDQITPWRASRVRQFLEGPGAPHVYMVHVGIGWSLARLRLRMRQRLSRLDPLLHWLVFDGCGFHEGYFHWPRYQAGLERPKWLQGYEFRAFDQGLGRSLWFVSGADPEWIAPVIEAFTEDRRADLWSGVGLACAYAGGTSIVAIKSLWTAAGSYRQHVGQGCVFAAGARERAGNPAPHTEMACRVFCGISSREAARISDETLVRAIEDHEPAYEVWRRLIRVQLAENESVIRAAQKQSYGSRVATARLQGGNQYVQ